MKLRKILTGVLAAGLCAANLASIPASAYGRTAPVVYANRWANSYNPDYLQCGSDCTNFVSQCVKCGGIPMYGSYISGEPAVYRNWYMESTVDEWYMSSKIHRTIGYDYWKYASSWTQVSGFRTYMKNKGKATVTGYSVNGSTSWFNTLDLGDVVQNGITGAGHSVIVTRSAYYGQTPAYCGHSNPALNLSLQNMVVDARNRGASYLYAVKFK